MTNRGTVGGIPRFWSARDAVVGLDADGFLTDPTTTFLTSTLNPAVRSADDIRTTRALVLLGEPGSGKSTALGMNPEVPTGDAGLLPHGFTGDVWLLQLGAYRSEDRLARELEGPRMQEWLAGTGELALVLDSFDECQAGVENLRRMLATWLTAWPTDRLVLRVACRTAQWPAALEERMRTEFGADFEVFEIAPLRATDAATIATAAGVAGAAFVDAVRSRRVGALAARPLLLNMLVAEAADGELPGDALALYRRGTRRLAVEHDGLRAEDAAALSVNAAVAVARRVAASAVFGAYPAVAGGDAAIDGDLSFEAVAGDDEPAEGVRTAVTGAAVQQVTASGLFTSRGAGRFGFAHYSFAEYLAADWVDANALAGGQVQQLLLTSDHGIVPTLRNVAAWLVAIDADRYGWLLEIDPEIALGGAVDLPSDELRRIATSRLFDDARAQLWRWRDYSGLAYPGLADDVRAQLSSDNEDRVLMACSIAAACKLSELVDELANIALDDGAPMQTRIRAGVAIRRSFSDQTTDVLAPLVTAELAADRSDELRDIALEASWPHAVDLPTVLDVLGKPREPNLISTYRHFINYSLAPSLGPEHVDVALPWLAEQEETGRDDAFNTLADAIVVLACKDADPARDHLLATILWRRAEHGDGVLVDSIRRRDNRDPLADDARRRKVLTALLDVIDTDDLGGHLYGLVGDAGPCRSGDFRWLAEVIPTLDEPQRTRAVRLAGEAFSVSDLGSVETLLELHRDHPLRQHLAYWVDDWPVDDPRGARWRHRLRPDPPPSAETVEGLIVAHLDHFEAGDRLAFVLANGLVAADDNGIIQEPMRARIVQRPRWPQLAESTRARFLDAAEAYVRGDLTEGWRQRVAGAHALVLVAELRPAVVDELEPELWRRWAPAIVTLLQWARQDEDDLDDLDDLIHRANAVSRTELQDALVANVEAAQPQNVYVPARLAELLWDHRLAAQLLELAEGAHGQARVHLFDLLAQHGFAGVRKVFADQLRYASDTGSRLAAARRLVCYGDADDWRAVLAKVYGDDTFGRAFVESVVNSVRYRPNPPISSDELSELFIWLSHRYPPSEDPRFDDGWVSPREQIAKWRDSLLAELVSRGDDSSVAALSRLTARFPERDLVLARLREAVEQRRRNEFRPLSPAELRDLAGSKTKMVVRSAADLRELLLCVLADIEVTFLHGNIPQVASLWNEQPTLRPKSEDAIADVIARQIDERLDQLSATALREVASRRVSSAGIPERSDILVHVRAKDRPVAVVIECKGAWYDKLALAMRSQLVDSYLTDRPGAEGIYLVFWFDVDPWDDADHRRARCASTSKVEVRDRINAQAAELRSEGVPVSAFVIDGSWLRPTS